MLLDVLHLDITHFQNSGRNKMATLNIEELFVVHLFYVVITKSWIFKHVFLFSVFVRLINQEGSLLSFAGSCDKDAKVTAAIASSIWAAYEKNGKMAFHSDDLKMIFMDCEVSIAHSVEKSRF